MLEHLEPDRLRENPTRFYGYSDNANLSLYPWNLGIVSFAGPSVMTELAQDDAVFEYTEEYVERAFFEDSFGDLRQAEAFTDEPGDWGTRRSRGATRNRTQPRLGLGRRGPPRLGPNLGRVSRSSRSAVPRGPVPAARGRPRRDDPPDRTLGGTPRSGLDAASCARWANGACSSASTASSSAGRPVGPTSNRDRPRNASGSGGDSARP